jgi:hypothetical protein
MPRPDVDMMIVGLDRYRAELEDQKGILEIQREAYANDKDEVEVIDDDMEILQMRIDNLTLAIDALENI